MKTQYLVLAILVTIVLLFFAVQGVGRHLVFQKTLRKSPYAQHRVSVVLEKRILAAPAAVNVIDLGYATFDIGPADPVSIEARGDGSWIVITNKDINIVFPSPFSNSVNSTDLQMFANGEWRYPSLSRLGKQAILDPIAANVEAEKTHPLPIYRLMFMNKDEFYAYSTELLSKAGNRFGRNRVFYFTTPSTKGIVRIGETPVDCSDVFAQLASSDGSKNVGCIVWLSQAVTNQIGPFLDRVFGSFQFTVDKIESRAQIIDLIAKKGIKRADATEPEP